MNVLIFMQELSPAQILAALAALPWMVVALMHLVSSAPHAGLDDDFHAHADAARRWADKSPDPLTPVANEVLPYRVRSAARVQPGTRREPSYIEHEAA